MQKKHQEIARFDLLLCTVVIGLRNVVVTPKENAPTFMENFVQQSGLFLCENIVVFKAIHCELPNMLPERTETLILPVITSQSKMLWATLEASMLRRIPASGGKPSAWLKKRRSYDSYDALLIDLLLQGCGDLAQDLARYRANDAPDPMDSLVLRVNHDLDPASPSLEVNLFGFWVALFKTRHLKLPNTIRKKVPIWALQTADIRFSELNPSHQIKAMDALKKYM